MSHRKLDFYANSSDYDESSYESSSQSLGKAVYHANSDTDDNSSEYSSNDIDNNSSGDEYEEESHSKYSDDDFKEKEDEESDNSDQKNDYNDDNQAYNESSSNEENNEKEEEYYHDNQNNEDVLLESKLYSKAVETHTSSSDDENDEVEGINQYNTTNPYLQNSNSFDHISLNKAEKIASSDDEVINYLNQVDTPSYSIPSSTFVKDEQYIDRKNNRYNNNSLAREYAEYNQNPQQLYEDTTTNNNDQYGMVMKKLKKIIMLIFF